MPTPITRKLTITDLMILVAATAVGAAMVRAYLGHLLWVSLFGDERFSPKWLRRWEPATVLMAWSYTLAVLACRLRRPRPRLGRLARSPGMTASLAAALLTLQLAAEAAVAAPSLGRTYYMGSQLGLSGQVCLRFLQLDALLGFAVAVTWVALILARRWRREPDWVDRAGRLLGAYWILVFLYHRWDTLISSL